MQSARRERFLREMPPDPVAPWGAVIKSIAGLAILTCLVTIGAGAADVAGSGSYRVRVVESASQDARAAAHRKSVFDARRARVDSHEHPIAYSRRYAEPGDAAR